MDCAIVHIRFDDKLAALGTAVEHKVLLPLCPSFQSRSPTIPRRPCPGPPPEFEANDGDWADFPTPRPLMLCLFITSERQWNAAG